MEKYEMKEQISIAFDSVNFRKFGNAFRKSINPYFKRECHLKSVGGIIDKHFTFEDYASYIIGDGLYDVNEEQFKKFMQLIK
jgi:hypothetical protein